MKPKIGILHYGCGNIRSVINAFEQLGVKPVLIVDSKDIAKVDKLVLPGVGAFDTAMNSLRNNSFEDPLKEHVLGKMRPILGICLGMQLLCNSSDEGLMSGLAFIDTNVESMSANGEGLKLPHIGWNSVEFIQDSLLFKGIPSSSDFYFVHSYGVRLKNLSFSIGQTSYGETFTSVLQKDHIFGVQFHPEKSHNAGLKMIQNFIDL